MTEHYENVFGKTLTLEEVTYRFTDGYPLVARFVQEDSTTESEFAPQEDNNEILVEKAKWLQFALVRILDFHDDEEATKAKGEEFLQTRKTYVGKEFLIPVCYSGDLKLINKPGRDSRYISVSQIIQDLPRFIRLNQDIEYTSSGESTKLVAGTKLEVKNVKEAGKFRYIKCKSSKGKYSFRDDYPINCSAIDDPDKHTFLNLAGKFIYLPKDAIFENICPYDVIFKDDEAASTLLLLLGGPIRILRSFLRRNVFVFWAKPNEDQRRVVGLIPRRFWQNKSVQIKTFINEASKLEYIKEQFGENLDSSFTMSGLYTLKPVEEDITWLNAPLQKNKRKELGDDNSDDDDIMDYEILEEKLVMYENVMNLHDDGHSDDDHYEAYTLNSPKVAPKVAPKPTRPVAHKHALKETEDYEIPPPPEKTVPSVPVRPTRPTAPKDLRSVTSPVSIPPETTDETEDYENPPPPEKAVPSIPARLTRPMTSNISRSRITSVPAPTAPTDETEDYEFPPPPEETVPTIPVRPTRSTAPNIIRPSKPTISVPSVPKRSQTERSSVVSLPLTKPKKEDIFNVIKEKARLGFDKVHEQLMKRVKQLQDAAERGSSEKQKKFVGRSLSEADVQGNDRVTSHKRFSKSVSADEVPKHTYYVDSQQFSKAYAMNRDRPLPELPTKDINITDDDKLDDENYLVLYDHVEDKHVPKQTVHEINKPNVSDNVKDNIDGANTLTRFPDLTKVGKADQNNEDFFGYTVEEMVECLKLCGMVKFAILCHENRLDGEFFRNFDLNELKNDPFYLGALDFVKIQKIINTGWRPKTKLS